MQSFMSLFIIDFDSDDGNPIEKIMSNFELWKVLSNRFIRRRNKCVEIRIKSSEALQELHYNIKNKKKNKEFWDFINLFFTTEEQSQVTR